MIEGLEGIRLTSTEETAEYGKPVFCAEDFFAWLATRGPSPAE